MKEPLPNTGSLASAHANSLNAVEATRSSDAQSSGTADPNEEEPPDSGLHQVHSIANANPANAHNDSPAAGDHAGAQLEANRIDVSPHHVHDAPHAPQGFLGQAPSAPHGKEANVKHSQYHATVTSIDNSIATPAYPEAYELLIARAHTLAHTEVVRLLHSDIEHGLPASETVRRLAAHGPNIVSEQKRTSSWSIFVRQVANCLTIVLLGAMALSFGVKDWVEGGVVLAVVVCNVVIGFVQEWKAERTMASLRSLSSPTATVLREGKVQTLASADLVPGDIVSFRTGDVIPADVRLVSHTNLETSEASLTGESLPVAKTIDALLDPTYTKAASDRVNLAFASTVVTKGRGVGVVISTGKYTEIGKVAEELAGKGDTNPKSPLDTEQTTWFSQMRGWLSRVWEKMAVLLGLRIGTPLQIKMNKFAYVLLALAVLCAIIVFSVAEFDLNSEIILYAIALGIGVIPESLIPVLTITFSIGAKRMAQAGVVVRRIEALEALGGVTNICSDKTGTLTQGKMVVRKIWLPTALTTTTAQAEKGADTEGRLYNVEEGHTAFDPTGRLYHYEGSSKHDATYFEQQDLPERVKLLAKAAALCNNASLEAPSESQEWTARGDPTEIALLVMATKLGSGKDVLLLPPAGKTEAQAGSATEPAEKDSPAMTPTSGYRLCTEFPFESDVKLMTTIYRHGDNEVMGFTKGAVERVLVRSCAMVPLSSCGTRGSSDSPPVQPQAMTDALRASILAESERLAAQGLRVLAFATRSFENTTTEKSEAGIPTTRAECEQSLTFLGLCALYDPLRPTSRPAVLACKKAGITVSMLTGDHIATARAIAREVGILEQDEEDKDKDDAAAKSPTSASNLAAESRSSISSITASSGLDKPPAQVYHRHSVLTAQEFEAMTDAEVDALPSLPLVIARCSPSTKVRMIQAGKRRGLYLAMTGDGVNDAPALKQAPIGIAMGGPSSTDVAKAAADMVLTDDCFESIVKAIREGRTIFDNIQRFVIALLVANVGEVILLLIGLAFQDEGGDTVFPLTAVEILWTNMVTASLPAVGLGMEAPHEGIMSRPPADVLRGGIFSTGVITDMLFYGFQMGWTCLVVFVVMLYGLGDGTLSSSCNAASSSASASAACDTIYQARSAVFTTLILQNLLVAWEMFSLEGSLLFSRRAAAPRHIWGNPLLFWSVLFGAATVPLCLYVPKFNIDVFHHGALRGEGWGVALAATVIFLLLIEAWKLLARRNGWPWLTRVTGGLSPATASGAGAGPKVAKKAGAATAGAAGAA